MHTRTHTQDSMWQMTALSIYVLGTLPCSETHTSLFAQYTHYSLRSSFMVCCWLYSQPRPARTRPCFPGPATLSFHSATRAKFH